MRFDYRTVARQTFRDTFDAYDAGVNYFSQACFSAGFLADINMLELDCSAIPNTSSRLAVIECPDRAFDDVREKDIYHLTRAAGELGGRYGYRLYCTPMQWKGQVPKKIHQPQHIWPKLRPEEQALFKGMNRNELKQCLDAAGIGLWYLGRL